MTTKLIKREVIGETVAEVRERDDGTRYVCYPDGPPKRTPKAPAKVVGQTKIDGVCADVVERTLPGGGKIQTASCWSGKSTKLSAFVTVRQVLHFLTSGVRRAG